MTTSFGDVTGIAAPEMLDNETAAALQTATDNSLGTLYHML